MTEKPGTYNPLLLVPKDPEPDEWKETLQRLLDSPGGLTTLPTAESKSSGTESAESSKSEATSQETAKEEHR